MAAGGGDSGYGRPSPLGGAWDGRGGDRKGPPRGPHRPAQGPRGVQFLKPVFLQVPGEGVFDQGVHHLRQRLPWGRRRPRPRLCGRPADGRRMCPLSQMVRICRTSLPYRAALQRGRPTRRRLRIRSMSYVWPTTASTTSAAGYRTRPSATGDAKAIPSNRIRKLLTLAPERLNQPGNDSRASSKPVTPTGKSTRPGASRNPLWRLPNPRPRPRRRLHPTARRRLQDESSPERSTNPDAPPPAGTPDRTARRPLPGAERTRRSRQQSHPNTSNEPGSGFTNFTNYRILALLYAEKPNRNLPSPVTPP